MACSDLIEVTTQNVKFLFLHQSAGDLDRAGQIGEILAERFKKNPRTIYALQEIFYPEAYTELKKQLAKDIAASEILNLREAYIKRISNGGLCFIFNKIHFEPQKIQDESLKQFDSLKFNHEEGSGIVHFELGLCEGEEQFCRKGVLFAKMYDKQTGKNFFILTMHAQSSRQGREDRQQMALAQIAAVGELSRYLQLRYPDCPVIFLGDLNIHRDIAEESSFYHHMQLSLPFQEQYDPEVQLYTYSGKTDVKHMPAGLMDAGLQESWDMHLDHIYSDVEISEVRCEPLRYIKTGQILSDHRGLTARINLSMPKPLASYLHVVADYTRSLLIELGKMRKGWFIYESTQKTCTNYFVGIRRVSRNLLPKGPFSEQVTCTSSSTKQGVTR